jgi:WhiB family redox-sensing transcriptional regulator
MTLSPAAWMVDAACADADPDLFFPTRGRAPAAAKALCAACPVRPECLDYAVSNGIEWGVWGGTSQGERRVLIRHRRAA